MRKECVTIAAHKEAYVPGDCIGKAMTVGELKSLLEDFNEDAPVLVSNDDGTPTERSRSFVLAMPTTTAERKLRKEEAETALWGCLPETVYRH